MLVQIDTGYACGGIVIEDDVCTEAAPIFRWMIGKPYKQILAWPKIKQTQEIRSMSKKYEKVGKGRFFENDTGGNENRPRFKGSAEIGGREFDMAIWPRVSKNGQNYLSVQFSVKGERESVGDGALFQREQKSNRAPALTGPLEIGGREFYGSVWPQTSEAGNEYYSLKVELITEEG